LELDANDVGNAVNTLEARGVDSLESHPSDAASPVP
jgi:hypothetical protein